MKSRILHGFYYTMQYYPHVEGSYMYLLAQPTHEYLHLYAEHFAKVKYPLVPKDSMILPQETCKKIGKAMLTHQELEKDPKKTSYREQVSREIHRNIDSDAVDRIWGLLELFLLGGNLQINFCFREGRAHPWLGFGGKQEGSWCPVFESRIPNIRIHTGGA